MTAFYNEIDPHAAAWLRELIKQGHIAEGVVDERSITEIKPADLVGYTQCHFFAGIGIWSHALRESGWSDDRPVWTLSCPCQPFSKAGTKKGIEDERHLWPVAYDLIKECSPVALFGEQVAGKGGFTWWDVVQKDLEESDYACGISVTTACLVGAPHKRARIYWCGTTMADTLSERFDEEGERITTQGSDVPTGNGAASRLGNSESGGSGEPIVEHGAGNEGSSGAASVPSELGHTAGEGLEVGPSRTVCEQRTQQRSERRSAGSELADTDSQGLEGLDRHEHDRGEPRRQCEESLGPVGSSSGSDDQESDETGMLADTSSERQSGPWESGTPMYTATDSVGETDRLDHAHEKHLADSLGGFWRDSDWLACRDGKWRPVECGSFPMVNGAKHRMALLRGYGNGIVAPQAKIFIESYMDVID